MDAAGAAGDRRGCGGAVAAARLAAHRRTRVARAGADLDARLGRTGVLRQQWRCRRSAAPARRLRSRREIGLRADFPLHAQDALADLARAIFDDRRLPVRMRFAQFFEQAAGKAEFRERGVELVVVLELFALLRGHVSLEEDFARIFGLRPQLQAAPRRAKKPARRNRPILFMHGRKRTIPELRGLQRLRARTRLL